MWFNGSPQLAQGVPLELVRGDYVVGRDKDCDVVVRDLSVSRRHARLTPLSDTSVSIEDLKSRNGTLVNGSKVARATAHIGDRLVFGAIEFLLARSPLALHESAQEGTSTARLRRDVDINLPEAQKLTPAQQRVLKLLLDGLDEQQIAGRCGCRPRTAHNHIQAIYRAFNVHSRQQLLARFLGTASMLPELPE